MSLLETLKAKLDPETFGKVEEALGDDFNYDLVPRSRLNKVIKQRNDLKTEVEELRSQVTNNEGDGDDDDDDTSKQSKTTKGKKEKDSGVKTYTQEELEAEIQKNQAALQLKQTVIGKLTEKGALDADLVYSLLDHTKIARNDKGEVTGLDDQLTEMTKSKGFLFKDDVPGGTGKDGNGAGSGNSTALDSALDSVFGSYGVEIESKG